MKYIIVNKGKGTYNTGNPLTADNLFLISSSGVPVHTHNYSEITGTPAPYSWDLGANGSYTQISDNEQVNFLGSGATSVSRSGNTITISSTSGTGADGNNYLTEVSGSGNGTMTFTRTGLANLTFNAAHTHDWSQVLNKPILDNYSRWEVQVAGEANAVGINSNDKLIFAGSGNTSVSRSGNTITISSTSGTGADGNNYPSSLSFATSNGILTLGRNGLSSITVDLDGRYLELTGGTLTGNLTAPAFFESSLREFKENIYPYEENALQLVEDLQIVTFDRKDSDLKNKIGIIADDTEKSFLNQEGTAVDLYKTIFIQAKAIQELKAKNDDLEMRLQRLEKLMNK